MKGQIYFDSMNEKVAEIVEKAAGQKGFHPLLSPGVYAQRPGSIIERQHLRAAQSIMESCAVDPMNSEVLHEAARILPGWVFTALVLVCACRLRFERLEEIQGWPARSAKVVVAIGLDELIRRGVV